MKFCGQCNREAEFACIRCGQPICETHKFRLDSIGDLKTIRSLKLGGIRPSTVLGGWGRYDKDLLTLRSFCEKVLPKIGIPIEIGSLLDNPACQTRGQSASNYFQTTIIPIIQEAREQGVICGFSDDCFCDVLTKCSRCGRCVCWRHSFVCMMCQKIFCAESHELDAGSGSSAWPQYKGKKYNCVDKHKHWFVEGCIWTVLTKKDI